MFKSEVAAVGIIPGSMGIGKKYIVTGNVCTLYLIRLVKSNTGHSFKGRFWYSLVSHFKVSFKYQLTNQPQFSMVYTLIDHKMTFGYTAKF